MNDTAISKALGEISSIYGEDALDFSDDQLSEMLIYFSSDFENETPGTLVPMIKSYRKANNGK